MANRTGEGFDRDELRQGDTLGASFLNRIIRGIASRFVGTSPIVVRPANGVIAISLEGDRDRRVVEKTILATLGDDNGDGTYTWTPFSKGPAESEVNITNACTEVNATVGLSGVVVLRKEVKIGDANSKWYFVGTTPSTYVTKHYAVPTGSFQIPFADVSSGRPLLAIISRSPPTTGATNTILLPDGSKMSDGQVVSIHDTLILAGGAETYTNYLRVNGGGSDLIDLGSPKRFYHTFAYINPHTGETEIYPTPGANFDQGSMTFVWSKADGHWWSVSGLQGQA